MDVKELEDANEAITMLKELDLPISIEQLGEREALETKFLQENVIPQIEAQIQSLVEPLHKSFCLVVEYQWGEPVKVRIAKHAILKENTIHRIQRNENQRTNIISRKYKSERIEEEWDKFIKSLPKGNIYYKVAINESYHSLSKLLRVMQSDELKKYTFPLFQGLNLPTTGKITPTAFINMLDTRQFVDEKTKEGFSKRIVLWSQSQKTEVKYGSRIKVFESDGITPIMVDKTKTIKEGQWSLKTLCDLMAQKEYFASIQ